MTDKIDAAQALVRLARQLEPLLALVPDLERLGTMEALGLMLGIACSEPKSPSEAPKGVAGLSVTPAVKNSVWELPAPASLPRTQSGQF